MAEQSSNEASLTTASSGSSAPSSESPSPSSQGIDRLGRVASLVGIASITYAWLWTDKIPDFRWAIVGIVISGLPAGAFGEVTKELMRRLLPVKK